MDTLNCKGKLLVLNEPMIMGIINVTTDSFYSGSRKFTIDSALQRADEMFREGAAIVDIGGQSTRPGSKPLSADEEMQRALPVIEAVNKRYPDKIISIDTYYSSVAKAAVDTGASIVNDISGGNLDEDMLSTVGNLNVPYVCMHMKGTPETMQRNAFYDDVTKEVFGFFIQRLTLCQEHNIQDIIIDPGFGFGKTIEHNFTLLKNLPLFRNFEKPLLVGLSRKSTVYKTLNTIPEEALNGTTVLHTIALLNGANILRTHDVKPAMEAVKLVETYRK